MTEVERFPANWAGTMSNEQITVELLAVMRTGDDAAASMLAYELLRDGKAQAATIWDAVYLAGVEYMICFPNNDYVRANPLHTCTSSHAMRTAYGECGDDPTRLYTLLQAVAWASEFRRPRVGNEQRDMKIHELAGAEIPDTPEETVAEVFRRQPKKMRFEPTKPTFVRGMHGSRKQVDEGSRMVFSFAEKYQDHTLFLNMARRMTAIKATYNAHDIKFPTSIFDSYRLVSAKWKPHLLAASMHYLHSSEMSDNPAVLKARESLS